jgi:cytochrome c oxidase subunit 2
LPQGYRAAADGRGRASPRFRRGCAGDRRRASVDAGNGDAHPRRHSIVIGCLTPFEILYWCETRGRDLDSLKSANDLTTARDFCLDHGKDGLFRHEFLFAAPTGRGKSGMAVALIFVLVAVGSVVFHFLSPWWWTPIASNWQYIDHTIIITFWITGIVFTAVVLFMGYCVFRFRHKAGATAAYEPENKRLEWWLTVVTAVGVAAMLAPGLFVWHQFVTVPAGATEFEVVGKQWQWSFRLPGKDGKLGTSDVRNIDDKNPLGLTPSDPNGQDDVVIEGEDLHLPIGKPVKVLLRSIDVLHDFYVPEFRAKMDMVPGMVTYYWFTPTRTGTFEILCAELCGVGHAQMRGKVIVEEEGAYQAWLEKQTTFAQQSAQSKTAQANERSNSR